MWRKKRLIIIGALVAGLLLVGSIGGIALAQTGTPAQGTGKTLLARVATILGIPQQNLENAFTQAQREMRDEAVKNRLQKMVSDNKTTQAEADQYMKWWQSRPNTPAGPGLAGPGMMGPMGHRGGMRGWGRPMSPGPVPPQNAPTQKP